MHASAHHSALHEFDSKAIVRYFELHEGEEETEELPLKPKALRERDEKKYTAPKTKRDPKASKVLDCP